MSEVVIRAEGLGKSYRLRHQRNEERYVALREVLTEKARALGRRLLGGGSTEIQAGEEEFWALRDVSFEVRQGEVLGIIGRNGAGKSTLLKIFSRITEPTEGRARISGRIGSLLEVGTGFHPELTGRENIYLNGTILGMTRVEIARKFDEIVAFAEVDRFLDTPVKRYSSGMYVRLAFAVAAHLELDMIVVDEVLSVGDVEFQKKCLGKMRDVGKGGRTVLFVSHNMSAVQELCNRAVLLEAGQVRNIGAVNQLVHEYLSGKSSDAILRAREPLRLDENLYLENLSASPDPVVSGSGWSIIMSLRISAEPKISEAALIIYSAIGTRVAILDLRCGTVCNTRLRPGLLEIRIDVDCLMLVDGLYEIGLYFAGPTELRDHYNLATFSVISKSQDRGFVPYPSSVRGVFEPMFDVQSHYVGAVNGP